jgi:8-oxo-dGTP pyrophosphatase MutT (NUDIX family)
MNYLSSTCNNCNGQGHVFHQCSYPITSYGLIVYRQRLNTNELEYLLIRRRHSIGYMELLRGKYSLNNKNYVRTIIDEMSVPEKTDLLASKADDFTALWSQLWGGHVLQRYRTEERFAREKFERLHDGITQEDTGYSLKSILAESQTQYSETEWGFPKGRPNSREKSHNCALREFEEETGYLRANLQLVNNLLPIEEIFTGSNYKSYKHAYYLAHMDSYALPQDIVSISGEVDKLDWKTYEEALQAMRPYHVEKQNVLTTVQKILQSGYVS